MKYLVMGGTRFNGLHLVQELVRQGHDVTVFNRGVTKAVLPVEVRRLYGDRKQPESLRQALSGRSWDAVFDVSAYNLDEVTSLVELLDDAAGHYVFVSSCGVLADSETLPYTERSPVDRSPQATPYAQNKIACEDWLLERFRKRGFPVTIVRPTMVYGPHNLTNHREYSYFVRLLRGRPILIPGRGKTLLHTGHVDDQARGLALVPGNKRALGEIYHITSAEAITHNGYVDTLARIAGVVPRKVYLSAEVMDKLDRLIFVRSARAGLEWEYNIVYTIEKARTHLGYAPQYDFESGHRQTFEWFMGEGLLDKLEFDFSYEDTLLRLHG